MQPRQGDGSKEAEKQPSGEDGNRRRRDVCGGSRSPESSAAVVDERRGVYPPTPLDERVPRPRSISARPATVSRSAAVQRPLGAESTQVPVNRRRPEIPVCKKGQEAESIRPTPQQEDNCNESTKFDAVVESILKKDLRSSSSDRARQRRKDANFDNGHVGEGVRRSNGCGGNSRRVLFKNNVSVYRFDSEPPLMQNEVGRDFSRRELRENGTRSGKHDSIVRRPALTFSRDSKRRSSMSALNDRRTNEQLLNPSDRQTEKSVTDGNLSSSSSIVIVGDFEVHVDRHRGIHRLLMSVVLPATCRHVDADRLLVKANRSGTRLRLVSEQSRQGGRRHGDEELDEQFTLPVIVDPYAVTARLERDRVLVIEAPVVAL